jgi:hypothetical protein
VSPPKSASRRPTSICLPRQRVHTGMRRRTRRRAVATPSVETAGESVRYSQRPRHLDREPGCFADSMSAREAR